MIQNQNYEGKDCPFSSLFQHPGKENEEKMWSAADAGATCLASQWEITVTKSPSLKAGMYPPFLFVLSVFFLILQKAEKN